MAEVLRYAAFTTTPEGGNPAGVVLDAADLDDEAMQAIAADVGYSETAFLTGPAAVSPGTDPGARHFVVRYFSPLAEVPFCGHATIATGVAHAERHGPQDLAGQPARGRSPCGSRRWAAAPPRRSRACHRSSNLSRTPTSPRRSPR